MQTRQKSTGAARDAGCNQHLGVSASGESALPGKVCTVPVCTQALCMCVTAGTSLPTSCLKQRPLLQLTTDRCITFNKAALLLLKVKHKRAGLFLLDATDSPIALRFSVGSCPQELSKNIPCNSPCQGNNIHPERLGEESLLQPKCPSCSA